MAIYQINPATKHEVILFPYTYLATTGEEAKHNTNASDLEVDERGTAKTEYALIKKSEGRLLYENATDWGKLSADEKANAFYASNSALLTRFVNKGSLVDTGR